MNASPLLLVAKLAPWAAVSTAFAAALLDGPHLAHIAAEGWGSSSSRADGGDGGIDGGGGLQMLGEALLFVLGGGLASFALLMAEVKLLQITSSLTLGVMGTVKARLETSRPGLRVLDFCDARDSHAPSWEVLIAALLVALRAPAPTGDSPGLLGDVGVPRRPDPPQRHRPRALHRRHCKLPSLEKRRRRGARPRKR